MNKYTELKKQFENQKHEENAIQMSAYMRNQFDFYGLKAADRRAVYHEFLKNEKKNKEIDWNFLDQCFADNHREFQYLVMDYLVALEKYLTFEDISKIEKYLREKQWWDTIDIFSKVIGKIGLKDSRVDNLMLEWSTDEDFWIRRVAIIHQLGRKEQTDEPFLETILVNNLGSSEFFINKAIGWSLRDYSKTNPEWVKNFIGKYKEEMDLLSIREGSKYI